MKVLFLSLYSFESINDGYICADLVRQFRDKGHELVVMTPTLDDRATVSSLRQDEGIEHHSLACGRIQKTNPIEKLISLARLDRLAIRTLKNHTRGSKFDLVISMVSHCAFFRPCRFVKKRDGAFLYTLVKDLFPQNAVDLGMLRKGGFAYKYFKSKENAYYSISDTIGVLSEASVRFLLQEYASLDPGQVEVNPNSISPRDMAFDSADKEAILKKYGVDRNKTVFLYGGNLGVPQGIDFLLAFLTRIEEIPEAEIIVVGSGTEFNKIKKAVSDKNKKSISLFGNLPSQDFRRLCHACDVGLVFLSPRFTVPNFPSRVLSYLEAHKPILFAVDAATDVGTIAVNESFGFSCLSGDIKAFMEYARILSEDKALRNKMGEKGYRYFLENYTVEVSYQKIISAYQRKRGFEQSLL